MNVAAGETQRATTAGRVRGLIDRLKEHPLACVSGLREDKLRRDCLPRCTNGRSLSSPPRSAPCFSKDLSSEDGGKPTAASSDLFRRESPHSAFYSPFSSQRTRYRLLETLVTLRGAIVVRIEFRRAFVALAPAFRLVGMTWYGNLPTFIDAACKHQAQRCDDNSFHCSTPDEWF